MIDAFLSAQKTCVLATINDKGFPQAATVGFSHHEQYNLFIGTNEKTRKYRNLQSNPQVAIVVGTAGSVTFQYEGLARQVTGAELEQYLAKHYEKVPAAKRFAGDSGQVYFLISPTWLRFSNLADPSASIEMTEFGDAL